jgi:uncharacterized protein YidB (DUF937 family)
MDLTKIATQILIDKLTSNVDGNVVASALDGLIGDDNGGIDVAGLVSSFMDSDADVGSLVTSWLGDGENASLSTDIISQVLGNEKVAEFATKLGVDEGEALGGIADVIPQVIDQSSSGGNLLDAVGGVSGLVGLASKFFK